MIVLISWLICFVLLVGFELMTVGLTTIWFAGGALVALVAAMIGLPFAVQVALFVAVSVLLVLFTRPLALRYLNAKTQKTNVDSLIGQIAMVKETIDNRNASGKVLLNGMEWSARSVDGTVIAVDTEVEVKEVQGVKLMVGVR